MTIAFANLPQTVELNKTLTARMVRKLVLGQVTAGPGARLWGPVAVSPTLLARMVEYERKVYERKVQPWEEKLKESPDRKRNQEKREEAKALVNGFREQYLDMAQQGLQFEHLRGQQTVAARAKTQGRLGWEFQEIALYGLPVFIYGETWTDVELTSLVLFALREAQVNHCLPDKVEPPADLDDGRLGEPVDTGAAVEKAAAALAKLIDGNPLLHPRRQPTKAATVLDLQNRQEVIPFRTSDRGYERPGSTVTRLSWGVILSAGHPTPWGTKRTHPSL